MSVEKISAEFLLGRVRQWRREPSIFILKEFYLELLNERRRRLKISMMRLNVWTNPVKIRSAKSPNRSGKSFIYEKEFPQPRIKRALSSLVIDIGEPVWLTHEKKTETKRSRNHYRLFLITIFHSEFNFSSFEQYRSFRSFPLLYFLLPISILPSSLHISATENKKKRTFTRAQHTPSQTDIFLKSLLTRNM